jgi:hypothetical protein
MLTSSMLVGIGAAACVSQAARGIPVSAKQEWYMGAATDDATGVRVQQSASGAAAQQAHQPMKHVCFRVAGCSTSSV